MATTLGQLEEFADSSLRHFALHSVSGLFIGLVVGSVLTRHRINLGLYTSGLGGGFSLCHTFAVQRSMQPPVFKATTEQLECVDALHMLVHLMDSCPVDSSLVL